MSVDREPTDDFDFESMAVARQRAEGDEKEGWKKKLQRKELHLFRSLRNTGDGPRKNLSNRATYIVSDAIKWLAEIPAQSIHAVVTDPPYGLIEYEEEHQEKLRKGKGGVWRIPPAFDGANRRPLPRFTVLTVDELQRLSSFFSAVAFGLHRALVPGGHVFIASNPLLSTLTFHAFQASGFEKRGEIIRLTQTFRGGDRPKNAENEFPDVSMMPRSCWEPWGIFRKPFAGTGAQNLRAWGTSGLRRLSKAQPFKDVISCPPTRAEERELAPHLSLKPQRFLRQVVRASLPLGIGIVYDPFAGSGSTLAAAEAIGYRTLGTEKDPQHLELATNAFGPLSKLTVKDDAS